MGFTTAPDVRRSPVIAQSLTALIAGIGMTLLAMLVLTNAYRFFFPGRILPGVSVAGVDLSNQTPDDAMILLGEELTYPLSGQVVFRHEEEVWVAHPRELGMVFDLGATVQQAYETGRSNMFFSLAGQLNALQGGLEVAPVILFDERVAHGYLQNLAVKFNRPMVEANLAIKGTEVEYTPGQTGREMDVDATLERLSEQLRTFSDGEVALVISEVEPQIADATAVVDTLNQILSGSLTLRIAEAQPGDPGPWILEPWQVIGMLSLEQVEVDGAWKYEILVDLRSLEVLLEQIAPQVDRPSRNARFFFDDYTRQLVLIEPGEEGRTLDVSATAARIAASMLDGEHEILLMLDTEPPAVPSDATADSLGITELVQSETSYFRGSGSDRLLNIRMAAAQFHGLLIPPNTTFSMGDAMGDISLDNGYAEALIIYNGRTITGVGGGVCQVSTTLFRTAFFGGYPIVERHFHAFRVFYYEQKPGSGTDPELAGLDATVYFPLVDLKFTNDRPYWLLMETYFYPETYSLEWKFYSTDDGRSVDVRNLGLRNLIPAPDPLFEENADLAPGSCIQVDYPADGADITVVRVVKGLSGEELFSDNTATHYEAWQAVYQYGPGTEDPEALAAAGSCSH